MDANTRSSAHSPSGSMMTFDLRPREPSMAAKLVPSRSFLQCFLCALKPQCYTGRSHSEVWRVGTAGLSTSCPLSKDPSNPPKAGDRGPLKNYRRKMAKKAKLRDGADVGAGVKGCVESGGIGLDSLLEGMKLIDHDEGGVVDSEDKAPPIHLMDLLSGTDPVAELEDDTNGRRRGNGKDRMRVREGGAGVSPRGRGVKLDSLLDGMKNVDLDKGGVVDGEDKVPPNDLMGLLSGLKVTGERRRERPSAQFRKERQDYDTRPPRRSETKDKPVIINCRFLDPTAGPRLGLFNKPGPGVSVMPSGRATYAEIDEQQKLQALLLLRPSRYYDDVMEANRMPYPRQFPIDNESYYQGKWEDSVGFEEHVLLDHLLADFPKKGPVRHFMELVVTGLSKNPHYSAKRKREMVKWYRKYFSQFSPEQLQASLTRQS